jgi:hypothetical protein
MYPRSTTVRTSRWVVGTGSPHAGDSADRRLPTGGRIGLEHVDGCGRRTGTPPDGAASPTVHSGHASFHLPTNCNEDCAPRRRHGRVGRCRTGARRAPGVASAPRPEIPHARMWLTPRSLASCLSLVRRRRSSHCGRMVSLPSRWYAVNPARRGVSCGPFVVFSGVTSGAMPKSGTRQPDHRPPSDAELLEQLRSAVFTPVAVPSVSVGDGEDGAARRRARPAHQKRDSSGRRARARALSRLAAEEPRAVGDDGDR